MKHISIEMQRCNICCETKPHNEKHFPWNNRKNGAGEFMTTCRWCWSIRSWRYQNLDPVYFIGPLNKGHRGWSRKPFHFGPKRPPGRWRRK